MEIFKESDLEGFRHNEFAVYCETEELSKDFIEWCFKNGITWGIFSKEYNFWDVYGNRTCYNYENSTLVYCDSDYYLDKGYILKEFKGFDNSEDEDIFVFECEIPIYENGMPTLLEYFMQIHELEEGEEFTVNGHGRYRIIDNETEILEYDNKWRWSFISATDLNMLEISKAEWKPKQDEEYYYINFYSDRAVTTKVWNDLNGEKMLFKRGLIHKTREEAEKRLEEIIALNKK